MTIQRPYFECQLSFDWNCPMMSASDDTQAAAQRTGAAAAVHRKLAKLPSDGGPELVERDARAIAQIVQRHWGDDARKVLELALRIAAPDDT